MLVVLGLTSSSIDSRANITPSTVVQRLFLAPEKISIGIFIKVGSDLNSLVSSEVSAQNAAALRTMS